MSPVQVVDFFSGCGGTSLGMQMAGLEVIAGIDFDRYSALTFQENFRNAAFIERDIKKIAVDEVSKLIDNSRPVLFSGCAPCQPFSRQNRAKKADDPRRELLAEFSRFVLSIRPEYVVVENVPGAQNLKANGPFLKFVDSLVDGGYHVTSGVLRAGDFGVAQERKRFVIVASRVGDARLPSASDSGLVTVRDKIEFLPPISAGEVHADDPDHASMKLSELNLRRIRATPMGGSRADWPDSLKLACHSNHSGHSDVYGRMRWDSVASGLTTKCLSYSNGRFGHPSQDRAISLREAALLQSFPSGFRFRGPLGSRGKQVGNAVPPLLAKAIALALIG